SVVWGLRIGGAPWFFPCLLAVVALPFACFALTEWLYRSTVEASPNGLQFRGGWLGLGFTKSYAVEEISGFDTGVYMTSGTKVWTKVDIELANGKSRTIAKGLPGIAVARSVVDLLNQALGRS